MWYVEKKRETKLQKNEKKTKEIERKRKKTNEKERKRKKYKKRYKTGNNFSRYLHIVHERLQLTDTEESYLD